MSLLNTNNLTVGYFRDGLFKSKTSILPNINLNVESGDIVCIMGHNGSGKTTLLKSLCGLLPPISGEIQLSNISLDKYSARDLAKKISVVLSGEIERSNLTVMDILSLGRYVYTDWYGRLSPSDYQIINKVISLLDISSIRSKYFSKLSDGQKQKVMLGRALVQDTEILLLDEPTNFLDVQNKLDFIHRLRSISLRQGKTIIFSSHDWPMVLDLATKIWVINEDKTISISTPEDFILSGEINNFFNHSDYEFDPKLGRFTFESDRDVGIKVEGNVEDVFWTKHAIRKTSTHNLPPSLRLKVKRSKEKIEYNLYLENNSEVFVSIDEVLTKLKSFHHHI